VAWVESGSGAFRARHDSADARDARRVLESLELTQERLSGLFPRSPEDVTVILHGGVAALSLTNPVLPMEWLLTAPAARRYVGGWAGRREIHVLAPNALRARASNVPGSREMLALTAASLLRPTGDPGEQPRAPSRDVSDPRAPRAALGVAARWRRPLVLGPDRACAASDRPATAGGQNAALPPRPARRSPARRYRDRPAGFRGRRAGGGAARHPSSPPGSPRGDHQGIRRSAVRAHRKAWRSHLARLAGAR